MTLALITVVALAALSGWTLRTVLLDGHRRRPAHKYYDTRQPA